MKNKPIDPVAQKIMRTTRLIQCCGMIIFGLIGVGFWMGYLYHTTGDLLYSKIIMGLIAGIVIVAVYMQAKSASLRRQTMEEFDRLFHISNRG